MIIRKAAGKFNLSRYGGVVDGKNIEVRVGSVPAGTSPDAIPEHFLDNLSRNELKILRAALAKEQQENLKSKVSGLVADLNDMTSGLDSDLLDTESVKDLHKAASGFLKQARRVLSKAEPESSKTTPT